MIKILTVDDKFEIRNLLKIVFKNRRDIQFFEEEDGEAALRAIQDHRPDIVLLDIMMPGPVDGLGVLRKVKANPAYGDIRVFILSALGQKSDIDAAMSAGADAYFVKPFSIIDLMDAIDRNLKPNPGQALGK